MNEGFWLVIALLTVGALYALWNLVHLYRPTFYRIRNYDRDCEICGRNSAVVSKHGLYVCEECISLVP